MPIPPPATIGMPLAEVDTPALLIDLDAFDRNIARLAEVSRRTGVRLRPHSKTHKSPDVGRIQMAAGAVGVCCQKVSEAEVMVAGGVGNVLVSNEIAGRQKIARLAALTKRAQVAVCVDDATSIGQLGEAARHFETTIDTLVEINVGGNRCGIEPGEPAADLARAIAKEKGLRFGGLQAYQGRAQHLRTIEERRAAIDHAIRVTRDTVERIGRAGLACDIVGGAGTGTFELEAASGVYNELQAGSYVFMDADYARNKKPDGAPFDTFEHALFVWASVMSTPTSERAVVDAGLKAFSTDCGPPVPWGMEGVIYERPSDEHGILNLKGSNLRPRNGDKVALVPGHCDPTVNLHDWYVGIRGFTGHRPVVAAIWPVAARGAMF